jgi:malto-oligosyltrehalose synthase
MTPRATLRLQFHKGFAFADAARHVDYFAQLGVSHLYASPITTARAGSLHGYDVVDPTRVNPELGGEDALRRLVAALRRRGLGLIVDIVPNHMAVGATNAWWVDVLRHGRNSRYARYFDIDWEAPSSGGKVLLPFLGMPCRAALEAGDLTLAQGPDGPQVQYFAQRYPLREEDAQAAGTEEGRRRLDEVLSRQHYRLACWRIANDEINWRRFFDINELVALRMDHADAFEDAHALIFRLYAEGLIDGVRVDHIDGLSDPAGYCGKLRARLDALTESRPAGAPHERAYVVVEKILLRGETLPADWACDGTSGYDFMDDVSAVQHDARGEAPLSALWHTVSGRSADFAVEEQAARRDIIARSFSAQLDACARDFLRLACALRLELSIASLRRSLTELLVHFPIYRTYATADAWPARDRPFVEAAAAAARATCLPTDRTVVDHLARWLGAAEQRSRVALQAQAVTRFQQLSAPVAAKSVEDTAFYRYGRLLSRNDVGFDVTRFADGAADFHATVVRRHADFPHAMLATATHDHKRGEDVRARLAVLSEVADEWAHVLPRWIEQCRALRRAADGNAAPAAADIAILLQMIVGAWPLDLDRSDDGARAVFADRLAQWQEKALREAKLRTDWAVPNEAYELAAREFLSGLVAQDAAPAVLAEVAAFAQRISAAGAVNGLAQTLLKLTVPGVPDFYQGTEFWDFSLVDPDNRRRVDFETRKAGLDGTPLSTLARNWRDGRIKQAVIARTLAVRREHPRLFSEGSYEPLDVRGAHADCVIAFARRDAGSTAIVVVPRISSRLIVSGTITFTPGAWSGTAVAFGSEPLIDVFRDKPVRGSAQMSIGDLLADLPICLLASRRA